MSSPVLQMNPVFGTVKESVGPPERGERGTALILDAAGGTGGLLAAMLNRLGFGTLLVGDEADALRCAELALPDFLFAAVGSPPGDLCGTIRRIKHLSGNSFLPIVSVADQHDDALLARCMAAGSDDFISKPVSFGLLKARVLAMEHQRDLHREHAARQRGLADSLERHRDEQALAEHVLSRAVTQRNVATDRLGLILRPAAIFNGDLVLTQYMPDGGLRLLVGDFTGHGLAAAVGAMPVADAFHAMTRKGVNDARVLAEINRKLYHLLPADRFMAALLISVPANGKELRWWNGGMPSAWLRSASGLKELPAHALPLGILPDLSPQETTRRIRLDGAERLLLMSDGLLEASDQAGTMFVHAGFEAVLTNWMPDEPILPVLIEALDAHCSNTEQSDDITALEIPLDSGLLATADHHPNVSGSNGWSWSLELQDERLGSQPSLSGALKPLGLVDDFERHLGLLETVLAELYTNALDHGILKLDSLMKAAPDGFDDYYRERARRLAEQCSGRISIDLRYDPVDAGGCVRLRVADSGDGFPGAGSGGLTQDPTCTWGRGIPLLRQLCESVTFGRNGAEVEVVYRW